MRLFFVPIILLFLCLIFSGLTDKVFAAPPPVQITQTPNPMTSDTLQATITIESKDGSDIFVASDYSYIAWSGGTINPYSPCSLLGYKRSIRGREGTITFTPKRIDVSFNLTRMRNPGVDCGEVGIGKTWHFKLWAGSDFGEADNINNVIVDNHQFTIVQPGGNLVTITAKNPIVYAGQHPIVSITNAIPNSYYSFWWDGDKTITRYFPDTNLGDKPGQVEIDINTFYTDKSSRNLCWEYGYLYTPISINPFSPSCTKIVQFSFQTAESPPTPTSVGAKCTILPSDSPPLNSEVNLKIEDIRNGTKIAAYTVDGNGKQGKTVHGVADSTNSVILNLVEKANSVAYTASAQNEADGTSMCGDLKFFPGTIPGAVQIPLQKCGDSGCSIGGPDTCNDDRGAIKTTIGCIHTNPAEFVKDFVKFIIAISGGLAFLMMLLGTFQMVTSAGNPDTLNAGRERLTSAIIGLLFVIFAVLLMQIIGFDLLFKGLPGFGR